MGGGMKRGGVVVVAGKQVNREMGLNEKEQRPRRIKGRCNALVVHRHFRAARAEAYGELKAHNL